MSDQEESKEETDPEQEGARPAEKELKKSVDEEWKAQARLEKEKLDEKVKEEAARERDIPPADFLHFASGMAAQILMQLGAIENPLEGGEKRIDLAAARYSIDVLQMLAEKTKGNLTDEEDRYLRAALHDLRMRFVEAAEGPSSKTGKAGS